MSYVRISCFRYAPVRKKWLNFRNVFSCIFLYLGICFASEIQVPLIYNKATYRKNIGQLANTSTEVIVMFCADIVIKHVIHTMADMIEHFDEIQLIGSETMGSSQHLGEIPRVKPGFVYTRLISTTIPAYTNYLKTLSVEKMKRSPWFKTCYEQIMNCTFKNKIKNKQKCNSSEVFGDALSPGYSYYVSDKVVDAVYVFAHALHQVLSPSACQNVSSCEQSAKLSGALLLDAMRNSSFPSVDGRRISIDDKGEVSGGYAFHYIKPGNKKGQWQNIYIGSWQGRLKINSSLISGSKLISVYAKCSEPCNGNKIKQLIHEKPVCCWTCVECPDGSLAINKTTCHVCKQGYSANKQTKRCTKIPEVFYSLDKRISKLLVIPPLILAVLGILAVLFTVSVFIRYHSNPLIKASGRELCYILLTGLFLSFLFPFVSISRPSRLLCLSQFILDSLPLTISLVPIAMKTNRVVRIFDPTRKITDRPSFTRPLPQLFLSTLLISIQIILLLALSMMQFPKEKIVYFSSTEIHLVCSSTSTQIPLAHLYNLILILVCTYYGFKTRNIPSNFNEAKSIAFAMYASCITIIVFLAVFVILGNANSNEILQQAIQSYRVVLLANVILFCFFAHKVYMLCFQRKYIRTHPETIDRKAVTCETQKQQQLDAR